MHNVHFFPLSTAVEKASHEVMQEREKELASNIYMYMLLL